MQSSDCYRSQPTLYIYILKISQNVFYVFSVGVTNAENFCQIIFRLFNNFNESVFRLFCVGV